MAESSPTKVYDRYASVLNFKREVLTLNLPYRRISWIPADHKRRLQAYELLAAYYGNYSRDYRFSPESGSTSQNDKLTEMGDAAWLCDRFKSKLLGDRMWLSVEGPEEAEGNEAVREQVATREAFLRTWWKDNNVANVIDENETKCSYLGDCAYMVEWDDAEKTPKVKAFDPGFVFPDYGYEGVSLQEGVEATVKDRVTLAWEIPDEDNADAFVIFRDVYELRRVGAAFECWHRGCKFKYSGGQETTLFNLKDVEIVEGTDTGWVKLALGFLPFVWIPNIAQQGETFGKSNLADHIANLDGLINTANDMQRNSEYLGGAVVFASGKSISLPRDATTGEYLPAGIKPCTIYPLGENGRMDMLDTAGMQNALLDTDKRLMDKLVRNTSMTETGAGMVEPAAVPSGFALTMLLQPLTDKLEPMRSQRQTRYTTLFWMVEQLWLTFGDAEQKEVFAGEQYDVTLNFGPIVPTDDTAQLQKYNLLIPILGKREVLRMMKRDGYEFDLTKVEKELAEDDKRTADQQAAAFGLQQLGEGGTVNP